MCSLFWQMDNDHGDLSDILRDNGGGGGGDGSGATSSGYEWNFPPEPINFPVGPDDSTDDLSTIFHGVRDPLLRETENMMNSMFYSASNPLFLKKDTASFSDHVYGDAMMGQEVKPLLPPRMIQIGPNPKVTAATASSTSTRSVSLGVINPMNDVVKGSSLGRTDENGGVQANSPRNSAGKKRKNQIKKVVCIPAPTSPSSNRPTGEVVPSDLWAWRKYGQKPIKGSPYPRGYYRCSSSKACSARKQVERSRNDPNMLVITYTSEHNHPWPTQRNALAGSTRSQTTKAGTASASKVSPPPLQIAHKADEAMNEEPIKDNSTNPQKGNEVPVKDEIGIESQGVCVKEVNDGVKYESLEMDADGDEDTDHDFLHNYRPFPVIETQINDDSFFSELDELEPNPLKLLFPNGHNYEKSNEEPENNGILDPFGLYEWPGNTSTPSRKGF